MGSQSVVILGWRLRVSTCSILWSYLRLYTGLASIANGVLSARGRMLVGTLSHRSVFTPEGSRIALGDVWMYIMIRKHSNQTSVRHVGVVSVARSSV